MKTDGRRNSHRGRRHNRTINKLRPFEVGPKVSVLTARFRGRLLNGLGRMMNSSNSRNRTRRLK